MGFPEEEYRFESPLAALARTPEGFSGYYAPAVAGDWTIELKFFKPDKEFRLKVNGEASAYQPTDNGIVFSGKGGGGVPLRWEIEF